MKDQFEGIRHRVVHSPVRVEHRVRMRWSLPRRCTSNAEPQPTYVEVATQSRQSQLVATEKASPGVEATRRIDKCLSIDPPVRSPKSTKTALTMPFEFIQSPSRHSMPCCAKRDRYLCIRHC